MKGHKWTGIWDIERALRDGQNRAPRFSNGSFVGDRTWQGVFDVPQDSLPFFFALHIFLLQSQCFQPFIRSFFLSPVNGSPFVVAPRHLHCFPQILWLVAFTLGCPSSNRPASYLPKVFDEGCKTDGYVFLVSLSFASLDIVHSSPVFSFLSVGLCLLIDVW